MQSTSVGERIAGLRSKLVCHAAAAVGCATTALAQGAVFTTPGMPTYAAQNPAPGADMGQANRFTSAFNPAFSFIIDASADYSENDDTRDGADVRLRVLEFAANSWVDPNAWAYFVGAAEEEGLNVEEAAVHYIGFGGHHTIRAGRFFVDFGKQMQTHVHELRTLERPLVLRTYLGDEIKGDGLQWDDWISIGDSTAVRWSIGAFSTLLPEEDGDFDPETTASQQLISPKRGEDFNYTARLTGFTDIGSNGTLQLGASARAIPNFQFVNDSQLGGGVQTADLSNYVYGADATYGWVDDTGEVRWTFGGELLVNTGDNGADALSGASAPTVFDETVLGYFAWGDYAWDRYNSVGLQFSALELPDANQSRESEIEAYYTHKLSEFHRLRLVVTDFQSDANEDAVRFAIQYTAILGAHGHGVNW